MKTLLVLPFQKFFAAMVKPKADAEAESVTGERTGFSFIVGNMLFFLTSSAIMAGLGLGFLTRNTEGTNKSNIFLRAIVYAVLSCLFINTTCSTPKRCSLKEQHWV
ncbi:hypothetical protein MRX96_048109 [Rhipicephalus microplus]